MPMLRRHADVAGLDPALLREIIQGTAEAGGVAGGEELLRVCAGLPGPAHLFRHRQVDGENTVAAFGMAGPASGGGRDRCVQSLHIVSPTLAAITPISPRSSGRGGNKVRGCLRL